MEGRGVSESVHAGDRAVDSREKAPRDPSLSGGYSRNEAAEVWHACTHICKNKTCIYSKQHAFHSLQPSSHLQPECCHLKPTPSPILWFTSAWNLTATVVNLSYCQSLIYTAVNLLHMCSYIDSNGYESLHGICFVCVCSIENSSASDKVLQAVVETLQKTPFSYQGARILSGQEEGAFGWVTVNYLDDRLEQVCLMSVSSLSNFRCSLCMSDSNVHLSVSACCAPT